MNTTSSVNGYLTMSEACEKYKCKSASIIWNRKMNAIKTENSGGVEVYSEDDIKTLINNKALYGVIPETELHWVNMVYIKDNFNVSGATVSRRVKEGKIRKIGYTHNVTYCKEDVDKVFAPYAKDKKKEEVISDKPSTDNSVFDVKSGDKIDDFITTSTGKVLAKALPEQTEPLPTMKKRDMFMIHNNVSEGKVTYINHEPNAENKITRIPVTGSMRIKLEVDEKAVAINYIKSLNDEEFTKFLSEVFNERR